LGAGPWFGSSACAEKANASEISGRTILDRLDPFIFCTPLSDVARCQTPARIYAPHFRAKLTARATLLIALPSFVLLQIRKIATILRWSRKGSEPQEIP
jgi:hypothetical protein